MMSIVGKRDHTPQERADIETFLKTGGHGMDPAKTSWCAAAVGSALHKAGYQDIPAEKGGNIANAYQDWGRRVDPSKEAIQKDDVLVTTRGGRPGQMGGHVSLLTGEQDKRGRYKVVEGDTRNYDSPSHYTGHKADTDWENINRPGMMIRRGTRQSSPDAPTQVARKDTTTPRSIPSYKAAAEEPKPTQAAPEAPLMSHGTPSQQAHDLTPHARRDPEMSRTIPTHNQELREMSHARAASHEKAAQRRPTNVHHSGVGTNHIPEGSSGKHSTMPYGYDAGHFDSGLRDRFLAQYLDGMG